MAEWQIPAAWYVRALTPEQAHERVLTGNLGIDGMGLAAGALLAGGKHLVRWRQLEFENVPFAPVPQAPTTSRRW